MYRSRWSILLPVAALVLISVFTLSSSSAHALFAGEMNFVSDLISTSAPNTPATHIIQFSPTHDIPASGEIVITPQAGAFTIPGGLDNTDIEFSVSSLGGPYVDRPTADAADGGNDGIVVTTGTSGSIVITLNSTTGINANDAVRVSVGTVGAGDTMTNPAFIHSYNIGIATYDPTHTIIDSGNAMIAVVSPVSLVLPTDLLRPTVFNGLPSGEIAAGNSTIELSVQTVDFATCHYATSSGMSYYDMPYSFSPTVGTFFDAVLTGFQDGTTYNFYVRCNNNLDNPNNTDYVISFYLDPTPAILTSSSGTNAGSEPGEGYLGPGGEGNYPDGSAYLYLANVTLSGWTIPLSTVTVVTDGTSNATAQANTDGSFSVLVSGLERGTYTFQAYTTDTTGTNSASYASSLLLGQATNNSISGILIPPTIELSKSAIQFGDPLTASGAGMPNTPISVTVQLQSPAAGASDTHMYTATSTVTGAWQVALDTSAYPDGSYIATAREIQSAQSASGYSTPAPLTVGTGGASCSATPDMNRDGKVNLIDFSIFLTNWGGTGPAGDFNCDGQVNLADFSIMLFNWTG